MKKHLALIHIGIACIILSTKTFSADPFDSCQHCLNERIQLWMHCVANPKLLLAYPHWCSHMRYQASTLSDIFKTCINKRKKISAEYAKIISGRDTSKNAYLPYNDCDACIYQYTQYTFIKSFESRCDNFKKRQPYCEVLNYCRSKFFHIINRYPYILSEPLKDAINEKT